MIKYIIELNPQHQGKKKNNTNLGFTIQQN